MFYLTLFFVIIIIFINIIIFIKNYKKINFIEVKNINKIFNEKEIVNYINLNSKNILLKRMNSDKYNNYKLNCLNFTNNEKIFLKKKIRKINKKIKKYKLLNNNWNVIKTRNTLEYGNPFTMGKYIFLPENQIYDIDIEDTLIHEYIHINQRYNQKRYNKLYSKYLDWYLLKNKINNKNIKNKIINPDGTNNNWYFKYKNKKIIPFLIFNNGNYTPKYYYIKNNKLKLYNNQNELSYYLINKYDIDNNFYHPNEIIATILAYKITNNKKLDKNLIHFIN